MGVISVRLDDRDEAWLRKRRIKPGAFAREAVHEAIRLQEIREAREFLDKHRVHFDRPAVEMIREDRDSR